MAQVFDKTMSNQYYLTDEIKKALGQPAELHVMTHDAAINLSNFPKN